MARKCKTCGGDCSEFGFGKYKCSWCGHEYSEQDFIKENSNVADLETFSLLNKARLAIELEYDFKKSLKYSQSVLEKNPENQEANWLALLAENQVIYIQNDKGKHVPTFLESDKSCLTRGKYYSALNERYKADAQEVEKVRLAAVEEFKKVKPYDVFISYKQHESDGTSAETKEAVWARDIYTELKTNPKTKHLNIFFDQKCLSGANAGWEPHIYSAIKSSKCMILLGSSLDNINSRWVKNEWKRFIAFKARGEKKDFIVLGSDNVNPLLLDEKLQEKQMITNTSGRWLQEIVNRVSEICGKPKKEIPEEIAVATPPKKKKKLAKKAIIAIILCCILALGGGGLGFGLWYNGQMKEVSSTQELISYLPDYEIRDYSQYEDLFDAALESYESLSNFQKGKVSNRDRLLNALEGFNAYRIETLRVSVSKISVETVSKTDDLKDAVKMYGKLTADQRAMLDSDEIYALEQYAKVYNVITSLNEIQDDVINRYSEVEGIKRTYLTIDTAYQGFVYNYSLVDSFAEQVAFYSNFAFTEVAGGYSIALAEGKTLSGKVELPSRYNGQNVVEIPEKAFENCRGITSLVVPDTVLTIGNGAFQGCNNIVDITVPFTGKSKKVENEYEAVFGYIFGYDIKKLHSGSQAGGFVNTQVSPINNTVCQYSYNHFFVNYHYCYYLPSALRSVTITQQTDVPFAAFNNCSMLTQVVYICSIQFTGEYAFQNCVSPTQSTARTSTQYTLPISKRGSIY
ncbi:MAG: leucine-rich repeat protein [Clostridia bacterium]|nr:leucine-rich repeat protein [Clostridia bacterium]